MSARRDLRGQTFGRLTVVNEAEPIGGRTAWRCTCECGNEKVTRRDHLTSGDTISCGCAPRAVAVLKHGQADTPLYKRWSGMIGRTSRPNNSDFRHYGGRGISVCERWREFENFAADMGPTFRPELTLDRIDNDRGYEPGNCRWATRAEQNRNQRRNRYVTWRGRTIVLTDWADLLGLNFDTVRKRLDKHGWSVERALATGVAPDVLARLVEPVPADTDTRPLQLSLFEAEPLDRLACAA